MESVLVFLHSHLSLFSLSLPLFQVSSNLSTSLERYLKSGLSPGRSQPGIQNDLCFALNEQLAGVSWLLALPSSVFSFVLFKIAFYTTAG